MDDDDFPIEIEDDLELSNLYNLKENTVKVHENGTTTRSTTNRGQKRANVQIEDSIESISPVQTPISQNTSMPISNEITKSDEHNVAPIIYFRINYELVRQPLLLEKTIMESLKSSKILLNSIKITQNGNLLVYPSSTEKKKKLLIINYYFLNVNYVIYS